MTEFTSEWIKHQREYISMFRFKSYGDTILLQALDEIECQRAENEKLKEALKYIVDRGYTGASYVAQQALNEVTK